MRLGAINHASTTRSGQNIYTIRISFQPRPMRYTPIITRPLISAPDNP